METFIGIATYSAKEKAYWVRYMTEKEKEVFGKRERTLDYPQQVYVCLEGKVEETEPEWGHDNKYVYPIKFFERKRCGLWTVDEVWERAMWNDAPDELMGKEVRMRFKGEIMKELEEEEMDGKMEVQSEQMMGSCQSSSEEKEKEKEKESCCPGEPDMTQEEYEEKKILEYVETCHKISAVGVAGARCLEECLKICQSLGVSLSDVKDFLKEVKFMVDE